MVYSITILPDPAISRSCYFQDEEDEDAEEADEPTELPTPERAAMALGARPARWPQVATREQRCGNVQIFMASAKATHIEDGDLYTYDTDGEDRG